MRRGNLKFFDGFNWYPTSGRGGWMIILMFLLGAILGNLATALVIFGLKLTSAISVDKMNEIATFVSYPIMFIPAMLYARIKSRNSSLNAKGIKLDSNNFGSLGAVKAAFLVIVMTFGLSFCVDAPMTLMPEMPAWLENALKSMTQGTLWINFVCVSIFAPLFEEWLCRGMILRGLLQRIKPVWAIVISAAFFAFIHFNPWQAIPAFCLGCLFGYVYYKTGSLKLTMLMHFANNTLSLVISQIDSLSDYTSWFEIFPAQQYWIIFSAFVLLIVLSIRQFAKIPKLSDKGNCSEVPSLFDQ